MKSKKFQAAQYGFELDVFVMEKSSEEVKVFKICDISDTEVGVLEQIDGENGDGKTIDMDEFLHGWRPYKGKVTTKLTGWSSASCTPSQSEAWVLDGARGAVALAVRSEWMSHTRHLDELDIFLHPVTVRVRRDYRVGELTLVAASQRIDKKCFNGICFKVCTFATESGDTSLYLASHFVLPINPKGEQNKSPWVAPFWYVSEPAKEAHPNMVLKYVKHTVQGIVVQVPVLVNKVSLKNGEVLTWNSKTISEPDAKRPRK